MEPCYYPAFLDLRRRRCVVVGGGGMAADKARELGAAGAQVFVVAARPGSALEAMASRGELLLARRPFRAGDLAGAFLAIAAGDDPAEREAVWREASQRGLPLNSVDDPPRCSFIAGAVVRRGALTVAISTAGRAPALAVRLRQWLESKLGAEHARFLTLAGSVRAALVKRQPDLARRRELWYALVDSDVLELLRRGDEAGARRRFAGILGVEPAAADTGGSEAAGNSAAAACVGVVQ
ncbi:MAG TPA: bifunctional precorrin-2 dehydrogenase/sirohydrochlorin ferrochelatase [Thermoanaerobaculia bacterium]|nr:bifunctional precorrin-2 dehydrogenase/sirohydrochlorin ferrochelatase [Thermoanaerobaculia bacterium]